MQYIDEDLAGGFARHGTVKGMRAKMAHFKERSAAEKCSAEASAFLDGEGILDHPKEAPRHAELHIYNNEQEIRDAHDRGGAISAAEIQVGGGSTALVAFFKKDRSKMVQNDRGLREAIQPPLGCIVLSFEDDSGLWSCGSWFSAVNLSGSCELGVSLTANTILAHCCRLVILLPRNTKKGNELTLYYTTCSDWTERNSQNQFQLPGLYRPLFANIRQ